MVLAVMLAALAYIGPGHQAHVWDCHAHRARGQCQATFQTDAAVTDNGQPVIATYEGRVYVKGSRCTVSPSAVAWRPCYPQHVARQWRESKLRERW